MYGFALVFIGFCDRRNGELAESKLRFYLSMGSKMYGFASVFIRLRSYMYDFASVFIGFRKCRKIGNR